MKDPADAIMMFAAGFGTRMGPLTKDTPKPLIPVAGRPLIVRSLELARAAGPGQVITAISAPTWVASWPEAGCRPTSAT